MKKIFLLIVLSLLSATVYAADAPMGSNLPGMLHSFFTVSNSDASVVMLSAVFGQVGSVLNGPFGILGEMFMKFNEAMLVLATILVGYGMGVGLVHTAHEGEFLGREAHSIWAPIRTVMGLSLLIPTKTGYCVLQICMMWIVLQGVGAADGVWSSILNYINVFGAPQKTVQAVISNPKNPNGGAADQSTVTQAQQIYLTLFLNAVCMHQQAKNNQEVQQKTQESNSNQQVSNSGVFMDNLSPTQTIDAQTKKVVWGFPANGNSTGCGSLSYPSSESYSTPYPALYYQSVAMNSAMESTMSLINNAAKQFVYNCGSDPSNISTCVATTLISSVSGELAASIQQGIVAFVNSGESTIKLSDNLQQAQNAGWSYAGSYYRNLTTAASRASSISHLLTGSSSGSVDSQAPPSSYISNSTQTTIKNDLLQNDPSSQNTVLQGLTASSVNMADGSSAENMRAVINILFTAIVDAVLAEITGGNGSGIHFIQGGFIHGDPIQGVQYLGDRIMFVCELNGFIAFIIFLPLAMVSAACAGINPVFGLFGLLFKLFGFIFLVIGMLFTAGLTLAVYVPMVPYIMFFFGVMGWLLAVIESMLAAPLVALVLTQPDGKDIYGRAQPSIMLMTNVFIRPTLMLFGFIGGMLLSFVLLDFLNSSFSYVVIMNTHRVMVDGHVQSEASSLGVNDYGIGPFELVSYMILYVSLVIVIINRCFSMIHMIPDQVLRWIGNQHQFGEYSRGAEEVGGMAKSGMGQVGQQSPFNKSGQSVGDQGGKALGGFSKGMAKKHQKGGQTGNDSAGADKAEGVAKAENSSAGNASLQAAQSNDGAQPSGSGQQSSPAPSSDTPHESGGG